MKTINISDQSHKALKAYCMRTGTKLQAVATKAIAAWIKKAAR